MSEIRVGNRRVIQEFVHVPGLIRLVHLTSRENKEFFCEEESTHNRVKFIPTSRIVIVDEVSIKGKLVKTVELNVIREDGKEGVLVFVCGHRHATFIEGSIEQEELLEVEQSQLAAASVM